MSLIAPEDAPSFDNVIFDLGGVLLDLDQPGMFSAFREIGIPDFEKFFTIQSQTPAFDQLETGHFTPAQFREALRSALGVQLADHLLDQAWNKILGTIPEARIDMLRRLRRERRTFLLSNTNAIHAQKFHEDLRRLHGADHLSEFFERAFFSFELGLRKPHVEIYQRVLELSGLTAKHTLFIDDSEKNILGALEAGLNCLHLRPGMEISAIFSEH